ncbi:hypothetical protein pdam_00012279 [Pocillopora damicornis]|uniref:Fibrinogen C-terminal domain-containing protein n=1 Tax=Pocillopora damicornis TaxID=46731 RepID=A0A3M6T9N3_POCDA|nr:hypothetical protein pdam_00012279 [Pocillopora damicornis]
MTPCLNVSGADKSFWQESPEATVNFDFEASATASKQNPEMVQTKNCAELYKCGQTISGVYTIDPDGSAATVEDSLSGHNGTLFSTWNRFPADHDCARKYGGGWWYMYIDVVCTVNSNLNGICPHSGSDCTIHWAKLNPKAKNNDPKTSEMKVRPADFS